MDRDEILKRISEIRKTVNSKNLPNIYLLHGNFTDEEIQELSKTHKITYDVVQESNEDTTQTEVIIYKKL